MAKERKVYSFEERRQVIQAVGRGASPSELSRLLGIPLRCIFRWLSWNRAGGLDALKTASRSGCPPKISDRVMRWLFDTITQKNPRQCQLDFSLWTLNLMRTLLKKKHGIEISKSSMSRLMAQLGLSPQRPIYRSYKQDPAKIEAFLAETFPALRERARQTGAAIYFVDEAAARSDSHRGTTWGVPGKTPVVEDSGGRFGLRMISAVSARGDLRFEIVEDRMNSERFLSFLSHLRSDAGKPLIVICDNARYHTSKKTIEAARAMGVELCFIPPCAPELNPDEQVWNHLKRRLGQKFIENKDEMKRQCLNILRSIQKTPKLVRSFFRMNGTRYADEQTVVP